MPLLSNEQLDDALAWEFVQQFNGGEDSFRNSTNIDPNQSQKLLNIIVRDNFEARTRPGADAIPTAKLPPIGGGTKVYALRYFDIPPNKQQLLASVGVGSNKHILKLESNVWTDLALPVGFPDSVDSRLAMAQGIDTMLISDGVTQGQIWDGTNFTATGVAGNGNFPVGARILCWHTARMFASGVASAPDAVYVSNLLAFSAGNWNLTTRSFRIGVGDGDPIVALASMQGSTLCCLKRNSIWLISTDHSTDQFGGVSGFSAAAVPSNIGYGVGCVGRDAWCSYGNDILFMAQDGVRSVQRMQSAAGQWQLTTPISQPIQPYIARINQAHWEKIQAIKYQEFAFFFVPLDTATENNTVLVWNGRLGNWVGAWTGWNGTCLEVTRFNGFSRFVFGDTAGLVNQWKDYNSLTDDATYQDNGVDIPCQAWLRSWMFGEMISNKSGYNLTVRFTSGNAPINFSFVADGETVRTWSGAFQPTGDILGTDDLPFLLASNASVKLPKGLRGLAAFHEAYLKIESARGWWWLKNISASAFINPLRG